MLARCVLRGGRVGEGVGQREGEGMKCTGVTVRFNAYA